MDEEKIKELLKANPGARRAAGGVLFPTEFGSFYAYGVEQKFSDIPIEEQSNWPYCSRKEILRLREIKTPHDYLLRMRAEAVANSARLSRVFERRRQNFIASGRAWSLTEYYASMNAPLKSYIRRLPRRQSSVVRTTASGFAPILEANAICLKSIVGDVVVVSESLGLFYYFMVLCLYGGRIAIPISSRIAAALIALRIMNGSEAQDFEIDPRCVLPPTFEAWVRMQVNQMLEFTFAHEFAHLILGHNDGPHMSVEKIDQSEFRTYSHSLEFSADIFAVSSVKSRNKDSLKVVSHAAYSVMLSLHLLQLVAESVGVLKKFTVTESHPTAHQRIKSLREGLGDAGQPERYELGMSIKATRDLRNEILAALEGERDDLLSFYGSMYIPLLGGKQRVDRIDF